MNSEIMGRILSSRAAKHWPRAAAAAGGALFKTCVLFFYAACSCLGRPATWVEPDYQSGGLVTWEWVQSITVDDLQLDRVDFIKVDVEGFEERVLKGGAETIKRLLPVIYFEELNAPLQTPANGVHLSPSFEEVLKPLGYDVRALKPGYPQLVKAGFPAVVGK